LYKQLVKLANESANKTLPIKIEWLLDEFANCPQLPDIEAMISVSRSRGMRFEFFIQSFSQLENVYGKEVAQIILDNCGLVFLKTNSQNTAEEISKRLGKKTIENKSLSQSISSLNYNGNKSISHIGRDLITPDEIRQLNFKTIIFPSKGYPIIRNTYLYKKFSCYLSGTLERKAKPLLDLSNTYFTVEQINFKKNEYNDSFQQEQINFYKEQEQYDKNKLKNAVEILLNIIGKYKYKLSYESVNNRTFCRIIVNENLNKRDKILIKNKIDKNVYYINFVENEPIVEIHLKQCF
jgi:type IV secretory pathway TraG/TraD family ATPase VirD4